MSKKRIGFILPDEKPAKMPKLEEDDFLSVNFGLLKQKHVYQKEINLPQELLDGSSVIVDKYEKLNAAKVIKEQHDTETLIEEATFAQEILNEQDIPKTKSLCITIHTTGSGKFVCYYQIVLKSKTTKIEKKVKIRANIYSTEEGTPMISKSVKCIGSDVKEETSDPGE